MFIAQKCSPLTPTSMYLRNEECGLITFNVFGKLFVKCDISQFWRKLCNSRHEFRRRSSKDIIGLWMNIFWTILVTKSRERKIIDFLYTLLSHQLDGTAGPANWVRYTCISSAQPSKRTM